MFSSLLESKRKLVESFEHLILKHKNHIEIIKSIGYMLYLQNTTHIHHSQETLSDQSTTITNNNNNNTITDNNKLNDPTSLLTNLSSLYVTSSSSFIFLEELFLTEKISTIIHLIGWYQNYLNDKYKLNKNNEIQNDNRFKYFYKIGNFIKLFECCILLIEIILKKKFTNNNNKFLKNNYFKILFIIEFILFSFKIIAIFKSNTNIPIFLNQLPSDEETLQHPMSMFLPQSMLPKINPFERERDYLNLNLNNLNNNKEEELKEITFKNQKVGKKSGKAIPSFDELESISSSFKGNQNNKINNNEQFIILLSEYKKEMKYSKGRILLYLFEIIYSLKPMIYIYLLSKYGMKDWKPFLISLFIEILTLYLMKLTLKIIEKEQELNKYPNAVGKTVHDEMKRRFSNLTFYFYKSPLFDKVMDKILKNILLPILKRIPLLGGWIGGYIEYMLMIQEFYFYSNPIV
ncbi:hypothetical protein ABK040_000658 [Willaertia magna]